MIKDFILDIIKFYQYLISPLIGASCKFSPSCSQYAKDYIKKYGISVNSIIFILYRIIRCNPVCNGGIDLVP